MEKEKIRRISSMRKYHTGRKFSIFDMKNRFCWETKNTKRCRIPRASELCQFQRSHLPEGAKKNRRTKKLFNLKQEEALQTKKIVESARIRTKPRSCVW